jgi:Immunity protein 50
MWWSLAQNPRMILAYYSRPPELLGIEVHSVRLHRDGPTVELVADMPKFSDQPSPRWPVGANTVQAGFRFFDVQEISLFGWGTSNIGDLVMEEASNGVRFQFESPTARLVGVAGLFDVTSLSGYIKEIA